MGDPFAAALEEEKDPFSAPFEARTPSLLTEGAPVVPPGALDALSKVKDFEPIIGPEGTAPYKSLPYLQYLFSPSDPITGGDADVLMQNEPAVTGEKLLFGEMSAMLPTMMRWTGAENAEAFFEGIKTGYSDMRNMWAAGQLGYELMGAIKAGDTNTAEITPDMVLGDVHQVQQGKVEQLTEQIAELNSQIVEKEGDEGFWWKLGQGISSTTTLMGEATIAGLPEASGAILGLAGGGAVAASLGIPGAPLIAAGALVLATKGASALEITKWAVGSTISGLIDKGVDPELAVAAGIPAGTLIGLIEQAQMQNILRVLPGGRQGLLKIIQRSMGVIAGELLEEGAQEAVTVGAEAITGLISNALKDTDLDIPTQAETIERVLTAMGQAIYSVGAMGGISGLTTGIAQMIPAEKVPPSPRLGIVLNEETGLAVTDQGLGVNQDVGGDYTIRAIGEGFIPLSEFEIWPSTEEELLFTPLGYENDITLTEEEAAPDEDSLADDAEFAEVTPEARREVIEPTFDSESIQLTKDAAEMGFESEEEFRSYVSGMYEGVSEEEIKQAWEGTSEPVEVRGPETLAEGNARFLETVNEDWVRDFLFRISDRQGKGSLGLSRTWWTAAKIGRPVAGGRENLSVGGEQAAVDARYAARQQEIKPRHMARMLKEIQNNPEKFRQIEAQLLNDPEMAQELMEQQDPESAASQEQARQSGEIRKKFLQGKLKWSDIEGIDQEFIREEGARIPAGTQRETFAAGKRKKAEEVKPQVERLRGKVEEEKQKARDKREAKRVRDYFLKVSNYISRDRTNSAINIGQKKQIQLLQQGMGDRFFSDKTLNQMEQLRKHLEAHPDALDTVPKKLVQQALDRPLNDLTIGELEARAEQIKKLEQEGRLILKLKRAQALRDFEGLRDEMVGAVLQGAGLEEETHLGGISADKKTLREKARNLQGTFLNMQRLLDVMDGGQGFDGPLYNHFWNTSMDMTDDYMDNRRQRLEEGHAQMTELGVSMPKLIKPIEKGGEYTRDMVLDMYMKMQNEESAAAVIHGNKIEPEEVQRLIGLLTEQEKEWGDWLIDHGYGDHVDRLSEALVEYTTSRGNPLDLTQESRYSPMRRFDVESQGMLGDLQNEVLERANLRRAYADKSFTIDRIKDIAPEHQAPVRLGATKTWMSQVGKQEVFIQNGMRIKEMQRLVGDKTFRAAVKQQHGIDYLHRMEEWLNVQADPNFYADMNKTAQLGKKVLRAARRNLAKGALGYNFVTIPKQIPSMLLMMKESSVYDWNWGLAQSALHPIQTQELMNSEPQIRDRSLDRIQEEMRKTDPNLYNRIMTDVGQMGFVGIWAADRAAITPGWMGVYHKSKRAGLSEPEARRKATNAVLRTQPVGRAKDVASMYRTDDELIAGLLMFSTQLNQIYGVLTHDIPADVKGAVKSFAEGDIKKGLERGKTAAIAFGSILTNAAMIWMIQHRRLPENEEDLKNMALTGFANYIPAIGDEISAGLEGWQANGTPVAEMFNLLGQAVDKGNKKQVNALLEEIALLGFGLPTVQASRIREAIETGDPSELVGGAPR